MNLKDLKSRLFKRGYKQEFPRVKIQNFHHITFWLKDSEYEVYNVSTKGLGFLVTDDQKFKKGDHINAVIKVLDQVCDIEVEVRHHTKKLIGCVVVGACDVYVDFIKRYFESELAALKLRLIDKEKLAQNENGEPHWLYGDYNHEIYFTSQKEEIITLQINYHGYIFLYDKGQTSTGKVWEDHKEDISYKSTDLVRESISLPKEMMEIMFRFVQTADVLESSYKKQILNILKTRFQIDWEV